MKFLFVLFVLIVVTKCNSFDIAVDTLDGWQQTKTTGATITTPVNINNCGGAECIYIRSNDKRGKTYVSRDIDLTGLSNVKVTFVMTTKALESATNEYGFAQYKCDGDASYTEQKVNEGVLALKKTVSSFNVGSDCNSLFVRFGGSIGGGTDDHVFLSRVTVDYDLKELSNRVDQNQQICKNCGILDINCGTDSYDINCGLLDGWTTSSAGSIGASDYTKCGDDVPCIRLKSLLGDFEDIYVEREIDLRCSNGVVINYGVTAYKLEKTKHGDYSYLKYKCDNGAFNEERITDDDVTGTKNIDNSLTISEACNTLTVRFGIYVSGGDNDYFYLRSLNVDKFDADIAKCQSDININRGDIDINKVNIGKNTENIDINKVNIEENKNQIAECCNAHTDSIDIGCSLTEWSKSSAGAITEESGKIKFKSKRVVREDIYVERVFRNYIDAVISYSMTSLRLEKTHGDYAYVKYKCDDDINFIEEKVVDGIKDETTVNNVLDLSGTICNVLTIRFGISVYGGSDDFGWLNCPITISYNEHDSDIARLEDRINDLEQLIDLSGAKTAYQSNLYDNNNNNNNDNLYKYTSTDLILVTSLGISISLLMSLCVLKSGKNKQYRSVSTLSENDTCTDHD